MTIQALPVEIYLEILKFLPRSRDESSVQTLLSCLQANSQVRAAALTSILWEPHYRARYSHCVEEKEKARKEVCGGDWRLLYIERRLLDRKALQLVDQIRLERDGRLEKAREFTKVLSFDVWDALKLEANLPPPQCFRDTSADTKELVPEALPRRFWAQAVLGVITRYSCVDLCRRLFSTDAGQAVSFEEALAILSSGFDVSTKEIVLKLNEIYEYCYQKLQQQNVQLDHEGTGYDLLNVCIRIREILQVDLGFYLASRQVFNRLLNQFPHVFLNDGHRETIPMSLVYVFVAVARRLGIQASPVNFPGAVQAHISSPDPAFEPALFDMCSDRPPVQIANIPVHFDPDTTSPASSNAMFRRAMNNSLMFIRHERAVHQAMGAPFSPEAHESAYYVISLCNVLETQNENFVPEAPDIKPLDALAVLRDAVAPALNAGPRALLTNICDAAAQTNVDQARIVNYRSVSSEVAYFVGMIFTHGSYGYTGCIYGWDPVCVAPPEWIQEMNVDGLPDGGRNQPFYISLDSSGGTRYVAQCNIIPKVPVTKEDLVALFNCRSIFSRYFVGFEQHEEGAGRLLLSNEVKSGYPDDDAFAASWIRGADVSTHPDIPRQSDQSL